MAKPKAEWFWRHQAAIRSPQGAERAIVALRDGLLMYGRHHPVVFASCELGKDSFLGPAWLAMARGYLTLLNGPTGRLDCGTLDGEVRAWATEFGFAEEV